MKKITSSVVIANALHIAPDGVPAKTAGCCALCGLEIEVGDLYSPLRLGDAFMDDVSMAARGSQLMCGYCPPLMTAETLRATGYGAFNAVSGLHPFRKWVDVADRLTNPPETPFVMVYATANNQHMAWRAPVNLSRDMFYVRVGLRDLKIRRQILIDAVEHCRIFGEALYPATDNAPASTRKTLPNPFLQLTPDLKDGDHGKLNPRVFTEEIAAAIDGYAERLAAIMSLTAGEVWALRFILTPGAGQDASAG